MAEKDADTVVILSSELISKITEEYFNKTMFKQKVEIVDLKPTDSGYMFSVVFLPKVIPTQSVIEYSSKPLTQHDVPGIDFVGNGLTNSIVGVRDDKGKFMKVRK